MGLITIYFGLKPVLPRRLAMPRHKDTDLIRTLAPLANARNQAEHPSCYKS